MPTPILDPLTVAACLEVLTDAQAAQLRRDTATAADDIEQCRAVSAWLIRTLGAAGVARAVLSADCEQLARRLQIARGMRPDLDT